MKFEPIPLEGPVTILPTPFEDHRGFFARWFCEEEFRKAGLQHQFTQCNQSGTSGKGSIRGMHFQHSPYAEVKMVKCIVGKIYDVIVDVRKGSPTFLKWFGVELTAEKRNALYIPKGFAHGFQTLTDYAEIIYMVSTPFHKEAEGGIRYNDAEVGITWPLPVNKISEKDAAITLVADSSFEGVSI
jgi:dTDP-4-dehydrorhamnose 3,5-epimerase